MKPTPPIFDLSSKEKVDEIPFCSNWKESRKEIYDPRAPPRKAHGEMVHSTIYDCWGPESEHSLPTKVSNNQSCVISQYFVIIPRLEMDFQQCTTI